MSSSGNPDIREQVDANRGISKRLELLVPGLRTYRKLEDIRVSDELLRNQVADKLDQARSNLEALRKQMAASGDFTNLTPVGSLISQFQQFSGEVRHSAQGYSGFAASIQMDEDKLNHLYNYDYDFVSSSIQLLDSTSPGKLVYDPSAPSSVVPLLSSISSALSAVKSKWAVRIEAIQNILLK